MEDTRFNIPASRTSKLCAATRWTTSAGRIEPEAPTFTADNPQQDWADLQFTRMSDEARRLSAWLRTRQAP